MTAQVPTPTPPHLACVDAIHRLGLEGKSATLAVLARRLGLAAAEAGERVLALQALGLVAADASGIVRLTDGGLRVARLMLRRHRVLERFLTDVLKLPWEQVHGEAARLTPVVSDVVTDGLARLAGDPLTCPHGNPIPAADGTLPGDGAVGLHQLSPGQTAIVSRIEREEPELLRYLAALGLLPETTLEVEEVGPLGGPILVRIGSARYALGRKVAAHVRVRVI